MPGANKRKEPPPRGQPTLAGWKKARSGEQQQQQAPPVPPPQVAPLPLPPPPRQATGADRRDGHYDTDDTEPADEVDMVVVEHHESSVEQHEPSPDEVRAALEDLRAQMRKKQEEQNFQMRLAKLVEEERERKSENREKAQATKTRALLKMGKGTHPLKHFLSRADANVPTPPPPQHHGNLAIQPPTEQPTTRAGAASVRAETDVARAKPAAKARKPPATTQTSARDRKPSARPAPPAPPPPQQYQPAFAPSRPKAPLLPPPRAPTLPTPLAVAASVRAETDVARAKPAANPLKPSTPYTSIPRPSKRNPVKVSNHVTFREGMTRDEYISLLDPTLAAPLLSATQRSLTLTPEQLDKLQGLQQSVQIDSTRGKHSLMEGNTSERCAVAEWTGFPLERTEEEVRTGVTAMFPSRCSTGKAYRLLTAGLANRVVLDCVPCPGVTKESGEPDWPPETETCLMNMAAQLHILQGMPVHRTHGRVPFNAWRKAMLALGYNRSSALPVPPLDGFTSTLFWSSDETLPPLVLVYIEHLCRIVMWKAGRGVNTHTARCADSSSAYIEMLVDDKPYVPQPRMFKLVETMHGVGSGGKTWIQLCDEWSQKVYGRGFATLEDGEKAVVLTALEGIACYGRDSVEWDQLRAPYSILFADSTTILATVQGAFDEKRAGKQVRATAAGMASAESTAAFWWNTLTNDTPRTKEQLFGLLSRGNLLGGDGAARVLANPLVSVFMAEMVKANSAAAESTAAFWWDRLTNDTPRTKEQLFGLLAKGSRLDEDGKARVLANPLVSVFLKEMSKLDSAAGKLNDRGLGFAATSTDEKYMKIKCSGKPCCGGVVHTWQVKGVPSPAVSPGRVVPGLRANNVKAHIDCGQYDRGKKRVGRNLKDDDVSDVEFDGVPLVN